MGPISICVVAAVVVVIVVGFRRLQVRFQGCGVLNLDSQVSPGVGGQEAALFAAELWEMYQRFSEHRGWKFEAQ
eukprot:1218286-Amphidinium_carterae.1